MLTQFYLQITPCLPLPRKRSPEGATTDLWWRPSNCSLLLIYWLQKDERLSWPSWLTYSGHKWSPVSCRSTAAQGNFAGQRPTFYHCARKPTLKLLVWTGNGSWITPLNLPDGSTLQWAWGELAVPGTITVCVVDRMLYWSVGGASAAARYIHRTTLDGAAADNVKLFVDVTDNSVTTAAEAAVQDIVIDVRTRRFAVYYTIPFGPPWHRVATNSVEASVNSSPLRLPAGMGRKRKVGACIQVWMMRGYRHYYYYLTLGIYDPEGFWKNIENRQEAQLSQRDRATLRIIEYFAKSLKVAQGYSKWHC